MLHKALYMLLPPLPVVGPQFQRTFATLADEFKIGLFVMLDYMLRQSHSLSSLFPFNLA